MKRKRVNKTTAKKKPKATTISADSGDETSDDETLENIRRSLAAEDDLPLAMLLQQDSDEDEVPLALLKSSLSTVDAAVDDELAALVSQPVWTDTPFAPPNEEELKFKGTCERPPADGALKTPFQYFKEIITDKMLDDMVGQANIYCMQKTGMVLNTTGKEIETFLGMYLRMGLMQANAVRSYWKNGTRYALVADHMGRNHFQRLCTILHFIDNNRPDIEEKKAESKVWKLNEWLNDFRKNLKKIPPEEHNAVDEIMVPFKGKSSIKMYMQGKPNP